MYAEVFRSPFEQSTKEEAMRVLNKIRDAHPEGSGWHEVRGYVEKLPNGKYRAVREQTKK